MINLMLEVEDDEDVSCTVEDMEAIAFVIFGSEGMGGMRGRGDKNRNDGTVLVCRRCKAVQTARGASERGSDGEGLRHYLFQAQASPNPR